MTRAEFLKRLGLGVVAIPLVPVIVRESFESDEDLNYKYKETIGYCGGAMISETCENLHDEDLYRKYGKKSLHEVLAIWRETGNLIF